MRLLPILLTVLTTTILAQSAPRSRNTNSLQTTVDVLFDSIRHSDKATRNRITMNPFQYQLRDNALLNFLHHNRCTAQNVRVVADALRGYCVFGGNQWWKVEIREEVMSPTGWAIVVFQPTRRRSG